MAISHRCYNNIVPSDIRRMFEGNWNWLALSSVIPLADIRRYADLPWDKTGLSQNPTLTVDDIQSLQIKDGEWNWHVISRVISMEEVRENPNLPWDEIGLSLNTTLTVDTVHHLLSEVDGYWDWDVIPGIRIIDVYTHPDLKWNRGELSWNKDIRIADLLAWHEIPPSIYKRWQYPSDVIII